MIGGVTRRMLPHLSGVPHLHVNRPLSTCYVVSFSLIIDGFSTYYVKCNKI